MSNQVWADKPWGLLPLPEKTKAVGEHASIYIANEMTHAHNCMIRGLNTIYLQADGVKQPEHIAALLFLAKIWCGWVAHHHQMEETILFPRWEGLADQPGLLEKNAGQHEELIPGLQRLKDYAEKTPVREYKGQELKGIIDEFANVLHTHLREEIETLYMLRPYDSVKLREIWEKGAANAAKQKMDEVPPMVLGLRDSTYEGGNKWPNLPFFAPYAIHYILAWKHWKSWQLLPCDFWGRPRELPFAKSGPTAVNGEQL